MHPLISRFRDLETAFSVINGPDQPHDAGATAFKKAVSILHQEQLDQIFSERGKKELAPFVEETLSFIAAQAAITLLDDDTILGPLLRKAWFDAKALGETEQNFRRMLAKGLVEEAVYGGVSRNDFDKEFVAEAIQAIAKPPLTEVQIIKLREKFVATALEEIREIYEIIAEIIFKGDCSLEIHSLDSQSVYGAIEEIQDQVNEDDQPRALKALCDVFEFLEVEGVIGSLRSKHLQKMCVL